MARLKVDQLDGLTKEQVLELAKTGRKFVIDKSVPRWLKVVAATVYITLAYLYLFQPFGPTELIADGIPVIGLLDDSVPFAGITWFAVRQWIRQRGLKMAFNKALDAVSRYEEWSAAKVEQPDAPCSMQPQAGWSAGYPTGATR